MTERGAPMSAGTFRQMLRRTGEEGGLGLLVHQHMLQHACGYKIANDGLDTRALQLYLGYQNIRHTAHNQLSQRGILDFWKD